MTRHNSSTVTRKTLSTSREYGNSVDLGENPTVNPHLFAAAAADALAKELAVVVLAADCMAGGGDLGWNDHDRLHIAHQRILEVLAGLAGRRVSR